MKNLFQKEDWNRLLVSWYLFDFAQALVATNITIYFSQWAVVDHGITDFWFAAPFILTTLILVFLTPYLGHMADRKDLHYKLYFFSTLLAILSILLMFFLGRFISNSLRAVILALAAYGLYQFFLQLAFLPYNSFLKHISPPEHYGQISGFGFAFGQLGWIVGLLITLPFTNHVISTFGNDRLAPLIPSLIAFGLFIIPSYINLRKVKIKSDKNYSAPTSFWKTTWNTLKESGKYSGVLPLLVSFYFFSDAIVTLSLFSAIYLQNVFQASDNFKVEIFILVEVGFMLGSFFGGSISDRSGHKRTLSNSLMVTAVTIAAIALSPNLTLNLFLFPLFGLSIGVVYAASRAYLASLIPQSESGKFFGLYVFAERFSSIFGPAAWGIAVWILHSYFPWNYRGAALAMAILVAIGIIPQLIKSKEK